jgi:hypothetical protein
MTAECDPSLSLSSSRVIWGLAPVLQRAPENARLPFVLLVVQRRMSTVIIHSNCIPSKAGVETLQLLTV